MKRALISKIENNRICEVKNVGEEFGVTDDFYWVDVPDDTSTTDTYIPETGEIKKFNPIEQPGFAENAYKVARAIAYKSPGEQLDMLYKELAATGTVSPDGPWAKHIAEVKSAIPKDNPQAVYDYIQADYQAKVAAAEADKNRQ